MEGRVDTEKYPIAAHIQQNFIALKQGPSTYRPGTAYVQPVKTSAQRTHLQRFEFSFTQAFILEFGGGYVRFYTNHGPLLATGTAAYNNATAYVPGNLVTNGGLTYLCIAATTGNAPPNVAFWYALTNYSGLPAGSAIYEIPSPYASADLTNAAGFFNLDIRQQGDVLYIMGGSAGTGPAGVGYPPYTLTRFSNNPPNWQFAQYSPLDGPFSPGAPIVPNANIALGVSAVSGNGITINAYGGNVFAATDVGRLVRVATQYFAVTPWATATAFAINATCSNNGNNYVALNSATTGGSPPVHTAGAVLDGPSGVRWLYTDSNYGIAKITAFVSATQVIANVLLNFPAAVVSSATAAITAVSLANPCVVTAANAFTVGEALFIFGINGTTQLNLNAYVNQVANGANVTLAGINSTNYTAWVSGGSVVGNASLQWQLGAWSNTTEWPRAVALFKDRLFLAGKLYVWGSVPGLYTSHAQDFFGQQTTDAAINVIVQGLDASNITWLSDNIILLIGTEGGEYGLDAANQTSPLGPTNVEILPQSQWRCRDVHPAKIGTSLLYLQRAGRKVFAADYNFYLNRYDSTDQNKFSYHITIGALAGMTYQAEPWSLLWAWRTDGTFLSYTFNREDNVTAWCRHNMGNGGIVESMAVIPSPDGVRDEYWAIVNRTVNAAVIRTVEYSVKHFEGPQAGYVGDAQSSAWHVDCGVQTILPPAFNIVGCLSSFSLFHGGSGSTTYQCTNTFSVGQLVFISGIQYTGTFNPNLQGVAITAVSPTTFTVLQNLGPGGTFNYLSGGTASVGSSSGQTITGLPPVMWNQTVSIFADGGIQPQQVVSATGSITLGATFNVVTIGFPYQGNLVPMRFEGGADVGTAQGKLKQGSNLVLRVIDSSSGLVGQLTNINPTTQVYQDPLGLQTLSMTNMEALRYNDTTTPLDSPPPFQSGDLPVSFPMQQVSDQDARDFYVLVQQNDPVPLTVAGLFPSYKVEENQ
jgi:hypothetical protein